MPYIGIYGKWSYPQLAEFTMFTPKNRLSKRGDCGNPPAMLDVQIFIFDTLLSVQFCPIAPQA